MTATPQSKVLLKINSINSEIRTMKTLLPFADGDNYYRDKRRIKELEKERNDCLQELDAYRVDRPKVPS